MSFRWYIKILSAFLLIIAVVIIPSTVYFGANLKNFLMGQKEEELKRELKLAAYMVSDQIGIGRNDPAKTRTLTNQVSVSLQRRVTIISKDGRVLGDSGLSPEAVDKLDDHSYRPEILEAKARGFGRSIRFSTTMQSNTLYGAVPVFQKGVPSGYVRLALPLSQLEKMIADLRWKLVLVGSLTGLLAVLLSFFLTWEINRPLREITDMVKRMAEGDLRQPFHLLPKSEFSELTGSLERMAKELLEKMELLDTETGQLKTLLSNMQEGVMITDDKGRIILMNPFLEEVLGKKISWKKRTVQEVFMNSELQDAVEKVMMGDPFQRLQLAFGRAPQRHFEVQVIPLTFSDRHRRAVAILHETTELRHLLKVRQDFVANASHELRTPLTSISGYVETLLSLAPGDPPELQRFLSVIQKNVRRMNLLVSDLLDLAKLDAKELTETTLKKVRVEEVLNTAVQMVDDQARAKKIDLIMEKETLPEDLIAYWEEDRIEQALFNVLDNAVKYTPEGGHVRLAARIVRSSESGFRNGKGLEQTDRDDELTDFLEITVEDTGIGIPKEHLPRIFERFYRVDKARSRELGGTGLGLSIVKHIVEAHRGTVQVRSVLDQGSTFTLILPLK
jgi:two-component system phosphate regulon sensor histidine kinase PhoR